MELIEICKRKYIKTIKGQIIESRTTSSFFLALTTGSVRPISQTPQYLCASSLDFCTVNMRGESFAKFLARKSSLKLTLPRTCDSQFKISHWFAMTSLIQRNQILQYQQ